MSKLDEEFEKHFRSIDSTDTLLTLRHEVAEYWFLAGAKSEREAVLEIIIELNRKFTAAEDDDALYPLRLLSDRIRQREDTNG